MTRRQVGQSFILGIGSGAIIAKTHHQSIFGQVVIITRQELMLYLLVICQTPVQS